jgi:hypothetical protein
MNSLENFITIGRLKNWEYLTPARYSSFEQGIDKERICEKKGQNEKEIEICIQVPFKDKK